MKRKFLPTILGGKPTLFRTLQLLGLTNGLQFCLDAGDPISYPRNGQLWLDRSGNSQDFFLGADGSTGTSDPTYSTDGYFSHDGGDYFTYDSSNETWMQNLHKDSAMGTLGVWVYPGSFAATQALLATSTASTANTGIVCNVQTSGQVRVTVTNGSGTGAALLVQPVGGTMTVSQWNFFMVSIDEAAGAGGLIGFLNGSSTSSDATYTSPSSGSASLTLGIANAGGTTIAQNGSRYAMAMGWSVPLSLAQMTNIYNATRGRFGV